MKRRVVITGLGALTCVGHGPRGLWDGILRERSGIGPLSRFDTTDFGSKCAGEINNFVPDEHFPPHRLKRLDRYAQFALVLAKQAFDDAGLEFTPEKPRRDVGVSFGTSLGGIATGEKAHERFLGAGSRAIPPALALQVFGGSAQCHSV